MFYQNNAACKKQLAAQEADNRKEISACQKLMSNQSDRIEAMEIYTRIDNLIIKGLPEQTYAERGTPTRSDASNTATPGESFVAVENTVISFFRDSLGIEL